MKSYISKIIKVIGYIIATIIIMWAAKEVFFTSVDKSEQGDSVEHIENQIP